MPPEGRRVRAGRWLRGWWVACALVASTLAPTAEAGAPAVVVEVTMPVGREGLGPTLRSAVTKEVAKLPVPKGKAWVVTVRLARLETKTSGGDTTTSCEVSIAVRDANGALRGTTAGTGTLVGKSGDPSAERAVLEAAVRGATRGLPAVLGKG